MGKSRVTGAVLATALLCTGAVACSSETSGGGSKAVKADKPQSKAVTTKAITAAYKKTAAAKSAHVEMVMKMPAGVDGGGDMKMSGLMGWDPTVMDMTASGSAFAAGEGPDKVRMVWQDNVMYMDMGAAAAKDMDGKRWMKMDLNAIADEAGDEAMAKQLTGSLDSANQDPAQQLAMLLDSPNLKHIGSEKIDGQQTQHYKGKLTVAEMMESNDSLDVLSKSERDELLKNVEKAGIKGYDTEVWVNEDDYPARMDIAMDSAEGTVDISMTYSDYGTAVKVSPPAAKDTFDLMEMMKGLEEMGADNAS
ncbi:hypothetical protein ACIQNU_29230 [Streptomyces sp. NPDC091292]|uniref:hypothetical protein n=1 Tax=Streptomyces sp. NPDC091292 TaxID=3365991 RepID=UPI0038028DBA